MSGDVFLEEVLNLFIGEHLLKKAENDLTAFCSYITEVLNNFIEVSNLGIADKSIKCAGTNLN